MGTLRSMCAGISFIVSSAICEIFVLFGVGFWKLIELEKISDSNSRAKESSVSLKCFDMLSLKFRNSRVRSLVVLVTTEILGFLRREQEFDLCSWKMDFFVKLIGICRTGLFSG